MTDVERLIYANAYSQRFAMLTNTTVTFIAESPEREAEMRREWLEQCGLGAVEYAAQAVLAHRSCEAQLIEFGQRVEGTDTSVGNRMARVLRVFQETLEP